MIYHILPVNDLKEHLEDSTCSCKPNVKFLENGDMLIIHNSFDGREGVEIANNIINNDLHKG